MAGIGRPHFGGERLTQKLGEDVLMMFPPVFGSISCCASYLLRRWLSLKITFVSSLASAVSSGFRHHPVALRCPGSERSAMISPLACAVDSDFLIMHSVITRTQAPTLCIVSKSSIREASFESERTA